MNFSIDVSKVEKHFSKEKIKAYIKENNFTYIEALFYLYAFNFVSISMQDLKKDCGREMYREFARGLGRMIAEFEGKED